MEKLTTYSACFGEGKYRVEAVAITCGRDVAVTVVGGSVPHIGATVLSVPRPSLADTSKTSSSSSVICVTGHKDDELARNAASSLASELGGIVTVSAGIHVDNASQEDLEILENNFYNVLDKIRMQVLGHYNRKNSM